MAKVQTGIAGEFWFFSQLHRLGYEAYITFGNTKGIDISVKMNNNEGNQILTFEVKSLLNFGGSYQYLKIVKKPNHYVVFINLNIEKVELNKSKILKEPECYIVESVLLDDIASVWVSSTGSATGYGFEAKLLKYLKNGDEKGITDKLVEKFKKRHKIVNDIDFEHYKRIIFSIDDFESNFYLLK